MSNGKRLKDSLHRYKATGSDWDMALEKFLTEECPDADNDYWGDPLGDYAADGFDARGTERRAIGYELELPPMEGHYTFTNYVIPANKQVTIKGPGVRGGTYIRSPLGEDFAFTVGTGWGTHGFEGLFFDQCCIGLEGDARGGNDIINCFFDRAPDYAIKILGMSVVGGRVIKCKFNRCVGAFGVMYQASDLWTMRDCEIVRAAGNSIMIRSSGVTLDTINIENTDGDTVGSNLQPHIAIEPGDRDDGETDPSAFFSGGLCTLKHIRFGDEVGTGNGPPRELIRLGPESPVAGTMTGINMFDVRFRGANSPYPDATHANNAILVTKQVARSTFLAMDFEVHNSYLWNDTALGGTPRQNTWQASVHASHVAGTFNTGELPPEGFKILENVSHAVVMFGASDLDATVTAQRFMHPGAAVGAVSTTEFFMTCPISGDLNKMYVTAPDGVTGVGAGNITFRARVDQVDTDHIVTISNTDTPFEGTTAGLEKHYTVTAGQKLSVRVTKSAAVVSCPTNVMVTFNINPTISTD